jgi:hypothetical protein
MFFALPFPPSLCRFQDTQKMMKNKITPEHESSSVGSSSGSVHVSFVRKASTVVPASNSGLVVREAGASLFESDPLPRKTVSPLERTRIQATPTLPISLPQPRWQHPLLPRCRPLCGSMEGQDQHRTCNPNSQASYESSEVASATVIVRVGGKHAATSVESTANSEISSENQSASSSHTVNSERGKTMPIPSAGIKPADVGGTREQYRKGDIVKYQNGKTAYTVRALLGCGAFGEVYLVWSEVQQKLRAMKCTKFGDMSLEERRARFQPMCEEAFIMMELGHHPNTISIRFVKVSGLEFLVIMDLIYGSHELSEAYQSGSIWDPLDKRPPSLKTISQTTSLLSLLWLQLAHAMDHLHGKHIMVCISCSFTLFIHYFSQF